MKYSIIAIGDELLAGQVTDTNSGTISRMLQPMGWELDQVRVVADDPAAILDAIGQAFSRTQVIITTGGLGPTKDDLTKQTLCRYFGGELRRDDSVLENVRAVVSARGIALNELTAAQAMVPTSCRVIQNRVGTAPIMWFEREGRVLVAMPGVPFETEQMMRREVMARLAERFPSDEYVARRVVMVAGMTESAIAMMLEQWEEALPAHAHLAYLPKPGLVRLRVDVHLDSRAGADTEADRLQAELAALIPPEHLLATDDLTPEEILLQRLAAGQMTLATAESCTGGNISHRITAIAGASQSYRGGVTAYANEVKTAALGVDPKLIEHYGAVSEQVVTAMAAGAIRLTGADVAVATSGVAGPGGGTPEKPVGTVWMATVRRDGEVTARCHHFPGTRDRVIDRASTTALLMAIEALA